MKTKIFTKIIFIILLMSSSFLSAQTDFSGTWTLDNSKSDAMYKDYKVTCTITQTPQAITIIRSYGNPTVAKPVVYTLDGKVSEKEEEGGINRQWTKWSADRKALTISETRTVGAEVYGSNAVHKLSPDGRTLTIEVSNIRPDDKKVIVEVYNKK